MEYELVKKSVTLIVDKGMTMREVARELGFGKSTIHTNTRKFINSRECSKELKNRYESMIQHHIAIRHINGGMATKKMYERKAGLLWLT